MAGFTHDVQKKQHRERSQPQRRKKYGLLEKKKDYKLRAADHHRKDAQIKILKQKAHEFNEDEYYRAMTTKKTDESGILISERPTSEQLSNDEVLLLKTQDAGYLTTIAQREAKRIEKDMNSGELFESAGNHTVFVDTQEDLEEFDPVKYFDTDKSLLYQKENRLRKKQLIDDEPIVDEVESFGDLKAQRDIGKLKRLAALKERLEREKKLRGLSEELTLQRELMKKGGKRKTVKNGKTVYKWQRQRKR